MDSKQQCSPPGTPARQIPGPAGRSMDCFVAPGSGTSQPCQVLMRQLHIGCHNISCSAYLVSALSWSQCSCQMIMWIRVMKPPAELGNRRNVQRVRIVVYSCTGLPSNLPSGGPPCGPRGEGLVSSRRVTKNYSSTATTQAPCITTPF